MLSLVTCRTLIGFLSTGRAIQGITVGPQIYSHHMAWHTHKKAITTGGRKQGEETVADQTEDEGTKDAAEELSSKNHDSTGAMYAVNWATDHLNAPTGKKGMQTIPNATPYRQRRRLTPQPEQRI